jgi:hypothetical protein
VALNTIKQTKKTTTTNKQTNKKQNNNKAYIIVCNNHQKSVHIQQYKICSDETFQKPTCIMIEFKAQENWHASTHTYILCLSVA